MTSYAASSLRLIRRLLSIEPDAAAPMAGAPAALDGVSAVALTEARLSESAALAASFPAAAAARVWARQAIEEKVNRLGAPLTGIDAESPRGALSAALGMALAGERATAFLSGPDLAAARDVLAQAAGQHVPLVLHLACRADAAHAQALGSGHGAYHAAADAGFFQLFAINVQEAADLALIARRAAERALVPGLVAMDGEQTALAAQDLLLPTDELIRTFLGEPSTIIEPPTPSQRMLFGETRRLVPRLFDLQKPMMLAPLTGPEAWATGAAGARPYFADHFDAFFDEACAEFGKLTGRTYGALHAHHLDDASIVLIAQGAAVETAIAVADHVRAATGVKVGVLGLRCLRPFPASRIVELLKGKAVAAVLERTDAPLSSDGPLLREIRAAFDHAIENAQYGGAAHPDHPSLQPGQRPRLVSVPFGLGGLPLRAADLVALIGELQQPQRSLIYLGLSFARRTSAYPKRQAMLDTLRRGYPDLPALSLRNSAEAPDVRGDGALTIAVHRFAGRTHESLAGDAAALMHESLGGHLRSRPALTWQRFDEPCVETLTHAKKPLNDAGDDGPVEIAVLAAPRVHRRMDLIARMPQGGALLLLGGFGTTKPTVGLPKRMLDELKAKKIDVFVAPMPKARGVAAESWAETETLLGSLMALIAQRDNGSGVTSAKLRTARESTLHELDENRREQRIDVCAAAFDSVTQVDPASLTASDDGGAADVRTPPAVKHLGRTDETVDSLPRFWDQVGVLYHAGETDELTADPYQAVGAIPPLSATFRDVSAGRDKLPAFDPATCAGHGELWTSCPDGSVAALAISARAVIDAGMEMATAAGKPAASLTPMAGKLAKRLNKMVASATKIPTTARGLLGGAFDDIAEKSGRPGDDVLEAFSAVLDAIGDLPLAHTKVFFDDFEAEEPGSGLFLALFVNPDACKCPSISLAAGEHHGLKAVDQTPENIEEARQLWDLYQRLPDTTGETIERAAKHPDVGPLAAMMLSRHCQLAMSGGDGAEEGSGAKLALRQALGACEYHLQPRLMNHLKQIDDLRTKLAEAIRDALAEGLPTGDLDALAEGIAVLGRDDVDLAALSGKIDEATTSGRVDAARLARLVEVARGLADLHWRLSHGPDGAGRARAGLAIAPGSVAAWAGAFPHNPFTNPVVIDAGGETSQLALGLVEGQLRHVIAGFRLMRWANLELEQPAKAAVEAERLAALTWADLTADERELCPPLIVAGDGRTLGGRGLSQLMGLLKTDLPVKVIVLSDIGGAADDGLGVDALGEYPPGDRFDLALLATLGRTAYVAQVSPADGAQFAEGVLGALAHAGPALIHVHAASPERHGFAPPFLNAQAALAVNSRAFPLLTFDPAAPGVFGACMSLAGNPEPEARWTTDVQGQTLTPVHWAATEQRFGGHFAPLESDAPSPTAIDEYLDLPADQREGRTPFINVERGGDLVRLRVGPTLIADADERMRLWRTLQELAGIVTPFTKQVRAAAEQDVAEAKAAEIAALKAEYEQKLVELKAGYDADAAQRVKTRLMALAGYKTTPNGGDKDDAS